MDQIKLICTPLEFYSLNDEKSFFFWLKKISCIEKFQGVGSELHLYVSAEKVSDVQLIELMGIFDRYGFDGSQLKRFITDENKDFFEDF